jgi:hypothetical protein
MAGYLAELVAPPKMELFGILPSCFRDTEALMHAVANLDDSYIPRSSELIRIEFAVRELGLMCAPGSADTAEHMFATALADKLAAISAREQSQYLEDA